MKVRQFMETEVQPVINDYWERGEFPHELIPKMPSVFNELVSSNPSNPNSLSYLMLGMMTVEIARVDPSISTFLGVHWGLCMTSIEMFGSEEQKDHWLPQMRRFEKSVPGP